MGGEYIIFKPVHERLELPTTFPTASLIYSLPLMDRLGLITPSSATRLVPGIAKGVCREKKTKLPRIVARTDQFIFYRIHNSLKANN